VAEQTQSGMPSRSTQKPRGGQQRAEFGHRVLAGGQQAACAAPGSREQVPSGTSPGGQQSPVLSGLFGSLLVYAPGQ